MSKSARAKGCAMSAEQNTAVLRKYFEELWNKGNLALINELIAPDMSLNEDKHVTLERWREALSAWLTHRPPRFSVPRGPPHLRGRHRSCQNPLHRHALGGLQLRWVGTVAADRKLHRHKGVHFLSPCGGQDSGNVGLLGQQDVRTPTRWTPTGCYRHHLINT